MSDESVNETPIHPAAASPPAGEAHERLKAENSALRLRLETERHARRLGLIDEDAAYRLLDTARVTYDASGSPTNLPELLQELAKERPYLAAQASPAAQSSASGGAPNPARTNAAGIFTRSQIADRSFWNKHKDAILKALAEGRVVAG